MCTTYRNPDTNKNCILIDAYDRKNIKMPVGIRIAKTVQRDFQKFPSNKAATTQLTGPIKWMCRLVNFCVRDLEVLDARKPTTT